MRSGGFFTGYSIRLFVAERLSLSSYELYQSTDLSFIAVIMYLSHLTGTLHHHRPHHCGFLAFINLFIISVYHRDDSTYNLSSN